MSKKIDIELALHQGRYGELIRYLDKRIDVLVESLNHLIDSQVKKTKNKNSKGGK